MAKYTKDYKNGQNKGKYKQKKDNRLWHRTNVLSGRKPKVV